MGSTNQYPQTPLLRSGSSLLSFAFDEAQNFLGEPGGTNLGYMSTDELELANMWTAEESQAMAAAMNPAEGLNRGLSSQFSLQKQGSLGLLRTLTADDLWKIFLPQQSNTERVPVSANFLQQSSLEDTKDEVVKERPIRGEITLEDFLVKAGIVRDTPSPNLVSGHQELSNQQQKVNTVTVMPSYQAQQVSTNQSSLPTKQLQQESPIRNLTPSSQIQQASSMQTLPPSSNQLQQWVPPIPVHRQESPIRTLTPSSHMQQASSMQTLPPSNQLQQQVPPIPVHRQQATTIHHQQQGPLNQTLTSFSGFPISRNDGGLEHKNVQVASRGLNNLTAATAANLLSCPPSTKTRPDVLSCIILPGQQGDCSDNFDRSPMMHQKQDARWQVVAEAASALGSVSNTVDGGHRESSTGRLSPLGGGLGAVLGTGGLGTSHGGNGCPKNISFGPCSPLSSDFDEGSPRAFGIPLSSISEFGNGQSQKKKRRAEPPVERVIERRQRRMIKNRESAARSRARKQAYTVELEAEVLQLKEENMELLRKQEEAAESRRKQILALMPSTPDIGCNKGRSLKRTHTGPW